MPDARPAGLAAVVLVLLSLLLLGVAWFLPGSAASPEAPPLGSRQTLGSKPVPVVPSPPGRVLDTLQAQKAAQARHPGGLLPAPAAPGKAEDLEDTDAPGERVPWPATTNGIRGAIDEALPELRKCYDGWLIESPNLSGRVVVGMTITGEADAGYATITETKIADTSLGHAAMEACVRNIFDDLRFEPPEHGTLRVNYPIVFANEGK